MSSWLRRLGTTLAPLGFASIVPASVGAQPHVYATQWGSSGTGNGQFNLPEAVATDAAGDVYVADTDNHRIQKFADPTTPTKATSWGRIKALYR